MNLDNNELEVARDEMYQGIANALHGAMLCQALVPVIRLKVQRQKCNCTLGEGHTDDCEWEHNGSPIETLSETVDIGDEIRSPEERSKEFAGFVAFPDFIDGKFTGDAFAYPNTKHHDNGTKLQWLEIDVSFMHRDDAASALRKARRSADRFGLAIRDELSPAQAEERDRCFQYLLTKVPCAVAEAIRDWADWGAMTEAEITKSKAMWAEVKAEEQGKE